MSMNGSMKKIPSIKQYHEIAVRPASSVVPLIEALSASERIMIYYLFRANLPGNRIIADQLHRDSLFMLEVMESLLSNKETLQKLDGWIDNAQKDEFFRQLEIYMVYLWANHGPYFAKEQSNEKRTPNTLRLHLLTVDIITQALHALSMNDTALLFGRRAPNFFDHTFEHTCCVANNIAASGVNFYSCDFTEEDYQTLSQAEKAYLNAYYCVAGDEHNREIKIEKYKIGGKYSQELEVSAYWLNKALEHAKQHETLFDRHFTESLEHLIRFIHTGDESDFRAHSVAWLKTNNKIDYLFGFIENYNDPKEFRGTFEAEVTIKALDMSQLNQILPLCEERLPFAPEFKRDLSGSCSLPNASINTIAFGSGQSGPAQITAAYCLPNYEDIRAQHGSKQIIYTADKGLGSLLNPEKYKELFYTSDAVAFLKHYDLDDTLGADIWTVHCILHETLGHGSGKLHMHTFSECDPLECDGTVYCIGDSLSLTPDNCNQFFRGNAQSLEELRAEIIALYTSIAMFDELAERGLYKQWPERVGKEKLIDWLIYDMAFTGLRRLQSQPVNKKEIAGAHAQANTILMNYLLDSGSLMLKQEVKQLEGQEYTVLGFEIVDRQRIIETIKELAIEVQRIKSTADGKAFDLMLEKYGKYVRDENLVHILQTNMKAVMGDLKVVASIYPRLTPQFDNNGAISDIHIDQVDSFVDQQLEYSRLALSKY